MRETKWPLRLAVVISVVWAVVAYALSYGDSSFSGAAFAVLGLIPLCVFWGIGWVLAGVFRQRAGRVEAATPIAAPTGPEPAGAIAMTVMKGAPDELAQDWAPSTVASPLAGPWRRFFARTLDLYIWSLVVGFVVGILNARFGWSLLAFADMPSSSQDMLSGILIIPIAIVCDVLVYAAFGNSIGKGLLGVKVQMLDCAPLPARTYAARSVDVWIRGIGLGIPIVALFTELASYRALLGGKRTSWDIKYGCRVSRAPRKFGHYLTALALFLAFIAALGYGRMEEQRQKDTQNLPPVSWQNPLTRQTATILPAGWRLLPQSSNLPPNTWLYADATNQVVVGVGFEAANVGLDEYADALLKGNPTLAVIRNGSVVADGAGQVWTGSGAGVASDSTEAITVRAHVLAANGGFWRVFAAAPASHESDIALEPGVFRAVTRTLTP